MLTDMNRLPLARRAQILSMLAEGNSLRATARMSDVSFNTVVKLLRDVAEKCEQYQDEHVRGIKAKRVQVDEAWAFVYAKQKNVPENMKGTFGVGDVWTWVGIDADTKLAISWAVGRRDGFTANAFMLDIADRLATRVQLTSDGHRPYLDAIEGSFGNNIDFAMLAKTYEGDSGKRASAEQRYSLAKCTGARKVKITGNPDERHISTAFVERQNLTMRMSMRRFTRLTNAFSKKLANHKAAVALDFMWYNFARIHQMLRVTPAMEAGISDHVWSAEEIARLTE